VFWVFPDSEALLWWGRVEMRLRPGLHPYATAVPVSDGALAWSPPQDASHGVHGGGGGPPAAVSTSVGQGVVESYR
jgi:hypothetical protein